MPDPAGPLAIASSLSSVNARLFAFAKQLKGRGHHIIVAGPDELDQVKRNRPRTDGLLRLESGAPVQGLQAVIFFIDPDYIRVRSRELVFISICDRVSVSTVVVGISQRPSMSWGDSCCLGANI